MSSIQNHYISSFTLEREQKWNFVKDKLKECYIKYTPKDLSKIPTVHDIYLMYDFINSEGLAIINNDTDIIKTCCKVFELITNGLWYRPFIEVVLATYCDIHYICIFYEYSLAYKNREWINTINDILESIVNNTDISDISTINDVTLQNLLKKFFSTRFVNKTHKSTHDPYIYDSREPDMYKTPSEDTIELIYNSNTTSNLIRNKLISLFIISMGEEYITKNIKMLEAIYEEGSFSKLLSTLCLAYRFISLERKTQELTINIFKLIMKDYEKHVKRRGNVNTYLLCRLIMYSYQQQNKTMWYHIINEVYRKSNTIVEHMILFGGNLPIREKAPMFIDMYKLGLYDVSHFAFLLINISYETTLESNINNLIHLLNLITDLTAFIDVNDNKNYSSIMNIYESLAIVYTDLIGINRSYHKHISMDDTNTAFIILKLMGTDIFKYVGGVIMNFVIGFKIDQDHILYDKYKAVHKLQPIVPKHLKSSIGAF